MLLEYKKEQVLRKPRSVKSKAKKVSSNNSKKSKSIKQKKTKASDVYEDVEAKFSVMERAERVLSNIVDEFPVFVKCMLPSNVAHGFWLHLPKSFCNLHFPNFDATVILVDEWGNEYRTSYLIERHGLSAGWRAFAISHRLLKGDILVFHLVEPCKLKVSIVRVHGKDVVNAALCLMNFDAFGRATVPDPGKKKASKKRKRSNSSSVPSLLEASEFQECVIKKGRRTGLKPVDDRSENTTGDDLSSKVVEDSEITDTIQTNDFYTKTPLLHGHPNQAVTCR